jgi:ribose transport system substrate-binding protein
LERKEPSILSEPRAKGVKGVKGLTRRAVLPALAAGLGACRQAGKKQVGVVAMGRTHLFWQTIHAGAEAAAREVGVEVVWNAPATEADFNGQIQIIDSMINRRLDAIALAPIDRRAMMGVVERAKKQGIPVIVFDSGLDGEDWVSWVATDNYAAGQIAAARLGEMLDGKGKVAIVAVQPGGASTIAREAGFEEKIRKDYPGIQIVDKRFGMADFAKSMAITENMLTAHPDLAALFASNESSTVGAMQALKARGSKTKLVGIDWSPNLLEELRGGLIDSLVIQNPFEIGYQAVVAAANVIQGKQVQKVNHLPPRLIRKDDLDKPDVLKLLNPDLKRYLG